MSCVKRSVALWGLACCRFAAVWITLPVHWPQIFVCLRTSQFRLGKLVEKKINSGNPAIPGNDKVSTGDCWRLIGSALGPSNTPAISHFLGLANWLIPKVMVHTPEFAS